MCMCVWTVNPYSSAEGDSRTSTAFMSEEGAQLGTAQWEGEGRGRGSVLSSVFVCMLLWHCVWYSHVCLNICVCNVFVYLCVV